MARLAELEADEVVGEREARAKKKRETATMETQAELAVIRAENDAETFDREQTERQRRAERQQAEARALAEAQHKAAVLALELEKKKHATLTEVERQMEKLPKPAELRAVSIGGAPGDGQSVAGVVAQVVGVVNALQGVGAKPDGKPGTRG